MGYYYEHINWDVRYPPNWAEIRRAAHRATGGICSCCKVKPSTTAHHTRYLWKKDKEGVNVFPVCPTCDKLCHSFKNWVKHKGNPLWKSHNTPQWEAKLKQGFNQLKEQQSCKPKKFNIH